MDSGTKYFQGSNLALISAGLTDIGKKRKTNQDSIYLNPEKNIYIVADGMGGHNGGDIASQLAVKVIPDYLLKHLDEEPKKIASDSIKEANKTIKARGKSDPKLVGMGTTSVGLIFKGSNLYLPNVGDSRAYLVNASGLYQMTIDHSLVQEKLNIGIYDRAAAAKDPHKNVLVRTVGFEDDVEVDVFTYKVSRYDLFLLCSDGLHGKVSDRDILTIIRQAIPDPKNATQSQLQATVQKLVDQANANGGNDNISVILVLAK